MITARILFSISILFSRVTVNVLVFVLRVVFFHLILGTLRSNHATVSRTSLKKVYLRSFSLYRDYSYPITLSNVDEPS